MIVLAGLGNPGAQYAHNRHNIGFMAIDAIARAHGTGPFRAKHGGLMTEARLGDDRVILFKPESFMNLSGEPVGALMRWLKLPLDALVVFHDDLDLEPGKVRVKRGGGHAGHNGLRSIQAHLGADYARVRLGIGHPGRKELVVPYVLGDFSKADHDWLEPILERIAREAPVLASDGIERFQAKVMSASATAKPKAKPQKDAPPSIAPNEPSAPELTPLQRLMERFR